ncbi:MAG: hypothetical protein AABW81_03225 [Nanoarchaeota archaeon]
MVNKTTHRICSSERDFLELRGDGTEQVKVTVRFDGPNDLNGWYVFLKIDKGRNSFVKQSTTHLPLIDRLFCETKYFQFDRNAGLLPNSFGYDYRPVGIENQEYEGLKKQLEEVGAWRNVKSVIRWEFSE